MPKNVSTIVDELNDALRRAGGTTLTMPWNDFYRLCGMERFKEPRPTNISKEAKAKYGLVVAYGNSVVVVCHDRNFAPLAA